MRQCSHNHIRTNFHKNQSMVNQSLMASFASVIDTIKQLFCCRPGMANDRPPTNFPLASDLQELGIVNDGCREDTRSPEAVKSRILTKKLLIPTLDEDDRRLVLKPRRHRTRRLRKDTQSSKIIASPPTITRFPNPWILIARDQETSPKTPIAFENRLIPSFRPNNDITTRPVPEIAFFPPIETIDHGGEGARLNLAPRISLRPRRRMGRSRHY
mmetsp:Transcript_14765/g.31785  ORF Transcript_14765/g.31785 Transcript_14765/m.31785 type:complete len:214 (-) Transcript_14765:95-736(-)